MKTDFLNRKLNAQLLIVAFLALGLAPALAHDAPPLPIPMLYSAKAITGKVVDAETKEPIERVIVVAQWKIDEQFVGHDKALIKVMETVTDSEGNYGFPAWGPVWLPPMADLRGGQDPVISYFKAGYWPNYLENELVSDIGHRMTPLGEFKGTGKTVELRRWDKNGVDEYKSRLRPLATTLPEHGGGWRSYPRMTVEINKMNRILQKLTGTDFGNASVRGFYPSLLSEEDREWLRMFGYED